MRLLVFGKTGQLAREIACRCPQGVEARFLGRADADLMEAASCAAAVLDSEAEAVINAAAWTAVDLAQGEEAAAKISNGAAPGAIAEACAVKGIPFLQVSTDYVFDGAGDAPFAPEDQAAPLNAYGHLKFEGENAVRDSGARHVILRTSWVFCPFGNNFPKSMLRLMQCAGEIKRFFRPASALSAAVTAMVNGHTGGSYHFSGAQDVSWAECARAIMAAAGLSCRLRIS
jgi:dTDP-4-dehydrorhamnose reductase